MPLARLADELGRLAPSECLLARERRRPGYRARANCLAPPPRLTPRPDWTFDPASARGALFSHFGVTHAWPASASTTTSPAWPPPAPCCSTCRKRSRPSLAHLRRLQPYRLDDFLFLDEVTRRSLELTRTLRDGDREGSLLSVLDRTVTPMGARLLQDWLLPPLAERRAIEARLDAVAELLHDHSLRERPARVAAATCSTCSG